MTDITPLVPRQPVPPLAVRLVGGGRFDVTTENSERFTLVCFIVVCTVRFAGRS